MGLETSLDQALLSTMTDEEREAISDADPMEIASLKGGATVEDDEPDDAPEPVAASPAEAAPVEPVAAAPEPVAAAPVETAAPSGAYRYALPDEYATRIDAHKSADAALFARHEAGDLSLEELRAEQAKLTAERDELVAMKLRADISADMQKQAMDDERSRAVNALFKTAKTSDAIDYNADKDKARDLDVFVRALAGDPANEAQPLAWFLEEGHKRVKALHGVVSAPPTKTPAEIKAAAVAARKPSFDGAPATLAQVPGGDGPGDVGGEFDDVMSLDGDKFEQAIANMARNDKGRYERFQAMKN